MPVHLESHTPDTDLTPGTTKSDIVAFLYAHDEFGYKPLEIRERLDIPHGTATATLTRLHDEGYIGKTDDSFYHALDSREDLRHYVTGLDQLHRMFNRPPENMDELETTPASDIDHAAVEAELDELEAELRNE